MSIYKDFSNKDNKIALKEFLDEIFGPIIKFDYSSTGYKSGEFKLEIKRDFNLLTLDELGTYNSEIASYITYLNDQISVSESKYFYYEDLLDKYTSATVSQKIEENPNKKITVLKTELKSDPNLTIVKDLYLKAKLEYNALKRKVDSLTGMNKSVSLELSRRKLDKSVD